MKVTISVTADDIEQGQFRPGNYDVNSYCPVARATQRTLDNPKLRTSYLGVSELLAGQFKIVGYFPPTVRRFMENFDRGEAVQPFTFDLKLPEVV